jgi:hypothetical protein
MFRLCKTAVIRLCISVVHKKGNHIAVAAHKTVKLMGKISSSHKIFVDIAFGKLDNILQYFYTCNILLHFYVV